MINKINAIAAICDFNNGIGLNNDIPWNIPQDFNYFLRFINTMSKNKQNALIVGRLTWLSMPPNLDEFKSNLIVIVSSKIFNGEIDLIDYKSYDSNKVFVVDSFDNAVNFLNEKHANSIDSVIAIGGTSIYADAIKSKLFNRIYLTRIFKYFDCDRFIEPKDFLKNMKKIRALKYESELYECQYNQLHTQNGVDFVFEVYEKN